MSILIDERLDNLTPRIFAYSNFIHSPELDRDDIRQEMYLALLEKTEADPTFLDNNDSYMAWFATWMAKHAADSARAYAGYVIDGDDETLEIILSGHDDEQCDPAAVAEQNEEMEELLAQIGALTPENQTVVKMVYLGYSNNEIAARLNISPAAVSWRKKNVIRPKLQSKEK